MFKSSTLIGETLRRETKSGFFLKLLYLKRLKSFKNYNFCTIIQKVWKYNGKVYPKNVEFLPLEVSPIKVSECCHLFCWYSV